MCPELPAPLTLAQGPQPEEQVAHATRQCAQALKRLGINFNLAPVLDLADQKAPKFLQARTLGKDPRQVATLAQVYLEVCRAQGLLCCGKHFPGLGGVSLDPHVELPRIEKVAHEALLPFQAMIAAGIPALMTTHLVVAQWGPEPVTFSSVGLRFLREELGFSGPVLTDDLDMGAISRHWALPEALEKALQAGHDLLLICQDFWRAVEAIKTLQKEVKRSAALKRRVGQAAERVARLRPNR